MGGSGSCLFAFCADFNRAKIAAEKNGEELILTDSVESVLVGATDVGIALGTAIAAAESMGLGTVPIGGARRNPEELIKLLNIPPLVFPVCGLVLGHPADPSAKSRGCRKKRFIMKKATNRNICVN
ncbi:nitroreductase family protein [Paenibacillus larvae]|nr:nitroreductase family protein [Paenibacillus larvae]MDT2277501.1 nitroreductase family protein [Paenibacillus larvae]